jgi:type I restriction enzyme S subunit
MVKEGSIRRDVTFSAIADNEIPFDLPPGWVWARVIDVGHDWGQKTPDADFTYIDVSAIDNDRGVLTTPNVLPASDAPSRARKVVRSGTVIYATVRPYLRNVCVIEDDYSPEPIASTAFAVLHPFEGMPGRFFLHFFRSPVFVKYVESVQTGIAYPAINDKQFYGGLVPIPPLAEQHRIVAKVDELMSLCDQLEELQTHGVEAHQVLVETLLSTLTSVPSPQGLNESWARVSANFDTLFTTEHSIAHLKQTILQLAIMGKLVPQDPNDEPARVLLAKIATRRAELEKDGRLKRQAPIPDITVEERPYALPPGWEFVRFGRVTFNRDAERVPLSAEERRRRQGEYDYYGASGVIDSIDDFLFDKPLLLIGEDGANLINRSTPIAFMARGKFWVNNHAHVLDGVTEDLLLYICLHVNAIDLEPYVTGTAQPKMNQAKMNAITLALPPEKEQKRIVAKVDELIAVCDALKARISDADTTRIHLADVIVEKAVA